MPEIITTPNALVQTTNGKRFYVNSGIVSVDNTETSVVDIANIGERDIIIWLQPILTTNDADDMVMKVKNNGQIIYQEIVSQQAIIYLGYSSKCFIIPSNSSLDITFKNADSSSHDVGVSCYGKYLSM